MERSDNIRAAIWMVVSMAAFSINDAMMKLASPNVSFFQGIFIRGGVITLGLAIYAVSQGHFSFKISLRDKKLILLRSCAEVISTLFFLTALFHMPIANLSAILQALPLTVTLAAAMFLKEPIGIWRLSAILIGFVGVLLIVQPGTDGFNVYSLFGLGAVVFVTMRDLNARQISYDIPTGVIAIAASLMVTAMAAIGLVFEEWKPVTSDTFMLLSGAAFCLMIGYVAAVAAMRGGDVGFVAPFRYVSLLVSLILGVVLFNEWPGPVTLFGAAIVVATGLFTLYRERHIQRRARVGLRIR